MSIIRQVYIGGVTYDIYSMGLWKDANTQYSTAELIQLINDAANAGFEPTMAGVDGALDPTTDAANATNYAAAKGKIYFKAESTADGQKNGYDEYIMVRTGTDPNYSYSWEVIGHTALELAGIKTVSTSANTSAASTNASGASSAANTGNAGGVTINGSNFSAESAGAHTHSISPSYTYVKSGAAGSVGSSLSVVASITTTAEAFAKAGTAATVATGVGSTVALISGVTYSTNKLGLKSITPVGGTTSAVGSRSSFTAVTAVSSETTSIVPTNGTANVVTSYPGSAAKLTTASFTANTDAIKSYPGTFAKMETATGYGTGTTTVYGTGTVSVVNAVTPSATTFGISVDSNGVLNIGSTIALSAATVTSSNATVSNGTSRTVANGTSFTYATGGTIATSGTGGAQIMVGLGTAVAATKATITYATGATSATTATSNVGAQILIGLGTASTTAVAKAGSAVTVVSSVTSTSETKYSAGATVSVATAGTATNVASGSLTTTGDGADVVISASGTGANSAVKTLSTTSITPVGSTANALVTATAKSTTNAITAVNFNTVLTGFTTTTSGNTKIVSDVTATGSAGDHTHSITGEQAVQAHSHSMAHTHSIAHTHSVTIPALSITLPNT